MNVQALPAGGEKGEGAGGRTPRKRKQMVDSGYEETAETLAWMRPLNPGQFMFFRAGNMTLNEAHVEK